MRTVHPMHPRRLVTADELEHMPDDDFRYELVEGRLIQMSPVGALHGRVTVRLLVMLARHVDVSGTGCVLTEVGFKLSSQPDTVRAPDIAFAGRDRFPGGRIPRGFVTGPPDLAVEVLSPDDRPSDMSGKVTEYLTSGVRLVWVVDPEARTVTAHRRMGAPVTLTAGEMLDAMDVVPGFSCAVRDIFE